MAEDDLLSGAHPPEQVAEEVSGVSGVELGEVAWAGVAAWRGLATLAEKPVQHGEILPPNLSRAWYAILETS